MARKAEAYVDTSALVAFADQSDTHHALFRRLFSDPPPLVTTPMVLAEGQGWFLRRYDRVRALQFMAMAESMPLAVAPVGSDEVEAATALLRRYPDQDLTLVDAVGLRVMQSERVSSCWSTDRHLGLTGIPLAIHRA